MSNKDQFIGSDIEGVETPEVVKPASYGTPAYAPKAKTFPAAHREGYHAGSDEYVSKARQDVLEEWRNRPLADPDAEVIGFDDWQRKIEVHVPGWEASKNLPVRRFKPNDIVYIKHGFMAHTLTTGTVYDNQTNYIQGHNAPDDLQRMAAYITGFGQELPAPNNGKRGIPKGTKAKVLGREGDKTTTVGLCPVYECEVVDGPLKGLRVLELPSMIVDKMGVDADGIQEEA